jgi:outer membrane protein OmpA-like peptidoglycan-associated protein
MHKSIPCIVAVSAVALFIIKSAQASDYSGSYISGKFGINNSSATGTTSAPHASTLAYGVQGGYLETGYNWDVRSVTIGLGAYADFNAYEKHSNGVTYGSRSYGVDTKLGLPLDDWYLYGKFGYGNSTGTRDLSTVSQKSPNFAMGVEYKIVARLGAIVEYKFDNFESQGTRISNKTLTFGLTYYFDRKLPISDVIAPGPEIDIGPPIIIDTGIASEPPPDIVSNIETPAETQPVSDPESWTDLLEGRPVRVDGTNFSGSGASASLTTDYVKGVIEVIGFAKKYPDAKFELIGHEDNTGSPEFLQELSLKRARSVEFALLRNGVAEDRMSIKGEGSADPIDDNNTSEGRIKNRRVEIFAKFKEQKKISVASPAPKAAAETWNILLDGKQVRVEGENFIPGTTKLKSPEVKVLDSVAEFASKFPDTKLELTGYADSSGSKKLNQKMSLKRAESAKQYLVKKGVADNRISTKGEGATNPIGDNNTEEGRIKNRRVEIRSISAEQNKNSIATPTVAPAPATATAPVPSAVTTPAPATVTAPVPATAPETTPQSIPESDSWKTFWPPYDRRSR